MQNTAAESPGLPPHPAQRLGGQPPQDPQKCPRSVWVPRGAPGQGPLLLPAVPTRRPTCCCLLRWGTACPCRRLSTPGGQTLNLHGVPCAQGTVSGTQHLGLTQHNAQPQPPPVRHRRIRPQGDTIPDHSSVSLEQKTTAPESQPIGGCAGEARTGEDVRGGDWLRGKTMKSPSSSLLQSQAPFQDPPAAACLHGPPKAHTLVQVPAEAEGTLLREGRSPPRSGPSPHGALKPRPLGVTRIAMSVILHKIIPAI